VTHTFSAEGIIKCCMVCAQSKTQPTSLRKTALPSLMLLHDWQHKSNNYINLYLSTIIYGEMEKRMNTKNHCFSEPLCWGTHHLLCDVCTTAFTNFGVHQSTIHIY